MKFPAGEKKSAKFWAPHPSAPTLRAPTFSGFGPPTLWAPNPRATTFGPPLFLGSGPHPFGPPSGHPPLRAPHPFKPPPPDPPTIPPKTKIGQMRSGQIRSTELAKFGQIRLAKCGQLTLAKCGIGQMRINKDGQNRFGQIRPRPLRAPHPSGPFGPPPCARIQSWLPPRKGQTGGLSRGSGRSLVR